MQNPIIGLTATCLYESSQKLFLGYERIYVNADYINAVSNAGGAPIILPLVADEEQLQAQIKNLDGIILTGGYDLSPSFFNENHLEYLGEIMPKLDRYELKIIELACKHKIPLFGICRGHQLLNAYFGGTLYQDITSEVTRNLKIQHDQKAGPTVRTHLIKTTKNSLIEKIYGAEEMVNSFHHMAIKKLAQGFKATALAPDGIIEAIENINRDHFIMGVQFHPEMTAATHRPSLELFKEFIRNCIKSS